MNNRNRVTCVDCSFMPSLVMVERAEISRRVRGVYPDPMQIVRARDGKIRHRRPVLQIVAGLQRRALWILRRPTVRHWPNPVCPTAFDVGNDRRTGQGNVSEPTHQGCSGHDHPGGFRQPTDLLLRVRFHSSYNDCPHICGCGANHRC